MNVDREVTRIVQCNEENSMLTAVDALWLENYN